ncbi:MAG: 50S ribosomal protein L9 [Gemmatimonadetes bacterium]|nr:50S ribosomal protein L9 [Gemmatimonadota bacterium]
MDIILKADVTHLGKAGDVLKVKDGYARNYLIPRGLANEATETAKRLYNEGAKRRATQGAAAQATAEELAARLGGVELTFTAKAGEGDKLFGSVTAGDIGAKLAEKGFTIDKRDIELEEPIRAVGAFKVPVRLHPAVRAEVRVSVVKE